MRKSGLVCVLTFFAFSLDATVLSISLYLNIFEQFTLYSAIYPLDTLKHVFKALLCKINLLKHCVLTNWTRVNFNQKTKLRKILKQFVKFLNFNYYVHFSRNSTYKIVILRIEIRYKIDQEKLTILYKFCFFFFLWLKFYHFPCNVLFWLSS